MAFSRFLQDSRDSVPAITVDNTQRKYNIIQEDDSVVVEADENKSEEKKDVKNDKIGTDQYRPYM